METTGKMSSCECWKKMRRMVLFNVLVFILKSVLFLQSAGIILRQVQTAKALRSLRFLSPGPQIKAFNPENSLRERRKLETKVKTVERQSLPQRQEVYDERGLLIGSGLDLCDCLDEDCPGCFLACPRCSSSKCGPTCRVNRKWFYDQMDVEGGEIYRNKYST